MSSRGVIKNWRYIYVRYVITVCFTAYVLIVQDDEQQRGHKKSICSAHVLIINRRSQKNQNAQHMFSSSRTMSSRGVIKNRRYIHVRYVITVCFTAYVLIVQDDEQQGVTKNRYAWHMSSSSTGGPKKIRMLSIYPYRPG
jgi:hypothetical protein